MRANAACDAQAGELPALDDMGEGGAGAGGGRGVGRSERGYAGVCERGCGACANARASRYGSGREREQGGERVAPRQARLGYNTHMEHAARILVVEDDDDINNVVAAALARAGYACAQAFSGSEARLLLKAGAAAGEAPFDLVITDLMLPGSSGEELVREIRARSDVPVIVVSARADTGDKVELLKLGADDYLAKPFDLDELLARVSVQLRHASRGAGRSSGTLRFKDWVLDAEARTLTAAGDPVRLTRLEFGIVEALVRRPKKVFTKRELFQAAWNEEAFVEEKAVNVHVSNIRGKLKPSGTDGYIETVWGIGFKLAE